MTEQTTGPVPWANRLNKLLNQYYAVHGGDRYPVNVEDLALQIPDQFKTGEPIAIQGDAMDPEFEGGLFNLNPGQADKGHWAIVFNQAISSPGRIRFTLAHELGHYLLHRQLQEAFNCNEADMLHWDAEGRRIETEADLFASYLLMPIDDFRKQVGNTEINLDVLSGCADRYGVSMTAAMLKWLEFTPTRAVLVMSRNGVVQWARGSESGKWLAIAMNKRQPTGQRRSLPAQSATMLNTASNVDRQGTEGSARIWFADEPDDMSLREMKIVSDQYKQTMTLLVLPQAIPPWERDKRDEDDDEELDNTFDHFIRNDQPPVR